MGKSSRRRRQRRRRQQTALARRDGGAGGLLPVATGTVLRVVLRMEQLELARGYDGLLRGAPEPSLVVGVFCVHGEQARLVGRYLYRFARPGGFPCKVSPREPSNESCTVGIVSGARLVILALAVEEDSGRGLQALYGELERGDTIVVWTREDVAPVPLHLHELDPGAVTPDLAHRIHVLLGERDPAQRLEGDDWVDASMLVTMPLVQHRRHRFHLCSADGRNDWTAQVDVVVRRA